MKHLLAAALALVAMVGPPIVAAQGFVDEPLCYSWEGGHKSAGSFSKCNGPWVVAQKPKPQVVAAPAPMPQIAPSPIMMPMTTCAPPPKPVLKKKRPPPKKC